MKLNDRQLNNLVYALKSHIKGSFEEKNEAQKVMNKYGCKNAPEAYKLIKENKKKYCSKYNSDRN